MHQLMRVPLCLQFLWMLYKFDKTDGFAWWLLWCLWFRVGVVNVASSLHWCRELQPRNQCCIRKLMLLIKHCQAIDSRFSRALAIALRINIFHLCKIILHCKRMPDSHKAVADIETMNRWLTSVFQNLCSKSGTVYICFYCKTLLFK